MENIVNPIEFRKLVDDVALIKNFLIPSRSDPEGELTDWAKNELAEARAIPDSENISLEEAKRKIFEK